VALHVRPVVLPARVAAVVQAREQERLSYGPACSGRSRTAAKPPPPRCAASGSANEQRAGPRRAIGAWVSKIPHATAKRLRAVLLAALLCCRRSSRSGGGATSRCQPLASPAAAWSHRSGRRAGSPSRSTAGPGSTICSRRYLPHANGAESCGQRRTIRSASATHAPSSSTAAYEANEADCDRGVRRDHRECDDDARG
jgi:hypothetical protein